VAFDPVEALAKFVDFDLQAPRLFELASRTRGCEHPVNDHRERDDPLGAMEAGHHRGRETPAAVPRAKGRTGDAAGLDGFFESDPSFFDGVAGKVAEELVPAVRIGIVAALVHLAPTTLTEVTVDNPTI
jgi:hypothetical protein